MADTHKLFLDFNSNLMIPESKKARLICSKNNLRDKIRQHFKVKHPNYSPKFWIQGSYKMGTTIRIKDNTCDIDDGVYFNSNPENVTCTTLQSWVKDAVYGVTDDIEHKKKCITVNYKADYNIDLPVYIFDEKKDSHPKLAVKNSEWREDDPKEMVKAFNDEKDSDGQLSRIVRYLKAWCDFKREKMPSGLSMTILAMNDFQKNSRDDVALKFTLIEIEKSLNRSFKCKVPATPYDDLFLTYDESRKKNFLDNLSSFITDAKNAVDEKNQLKSSRLWQKHLGPRFPNGEDIDEKSIESKSLFATVGSSRPYFHE